MRRYAIYQVPVLVCTFFILFYFALRGCLCFCTTSRIASSQLHIHTCSRHTSLTRCSSLVVMRKCCFSLSPTPPTRFYPGGLGIEPLASLTIRPLRPHLAPAVSHSRLPSPQRSADYLSVDFAIHHFFVVPRSLLFSLAFSRIDELDDDIIELPETDE